MKEPKILNLIQGTRLEEVYLYTKEKKRVSISQLVKHFNISRMTAHRYLDLLAGNQLIKRIRGGALYHNEMPTKEPHFFTKLNNQKEEKHCLARYAAKHFIDDGDIILLEAGTTICTMVHYIEAKELTLLSNGLYLLSKISLAHPDIMILCPSGMVRHRSQSIVGTKAIEFFKNKRVQTLFLSSSSVSSSTGINDDDPLEVEVKQAMIEAASKVIFLADSTKFHNPGGLLKLSEFSSITHFLTTDKTPEQELVPLRKLGIDIIVLPL